MRLTLDEKSSLPFGFANKANLAIAEFATIAKVAIAEFAHSHTANLEFAIYQIFQKY